MGSVIRLFGTEGWRGCWGGGGWLKETGAVGGVVVTVVVAVVGAGRGGVLLDVRNGLGFGM